MIIIIKFINPFCPHILFGVGSKKIVVTMQKSGVTVTRDVVLIKRNQIYLDAFGMKIRSRERLERRRIQRSMKRYP